MVYKLYDINGIEIKFSNFQDKGPWCKTGATFEEAFVEKYGKFLGIERNPEKDNDIYAPDIVNLKTKILGDLKTQNTPFFQSMTRYGIDPQYAVVFNKKDRDRYNKLYPDIDIYYWVDWQAIRFYSGGKIIEVKPLSGVWYIPFKKLDSILYETKLHYYQQRVGDMRGNARCSYVIDLNDSNFKKVI